MLHVPCFSSDLGYPSCVILDAVSEKCRTEGTYDMFLLYRSYVRVLYLGKFLLNSEIRNYKNTYFIYYIKWLNLLPLVYLINYYFVPKSMVAN